MSKSVTEYSNKLLASTPSYGPSVHHCRISPVQNCYPNDFIIQTEQGKTTLEAFRLLQCHKLHLHVTCMYMYPPIQSMWVAWSSGMAHITLTFFPYITWPEDKTNLMGFSRNLTTAWEESN